MRLLGAGSAGGVLLLGALACGRGGAPGSEGGQLRAGRNDVVGEALDRLQATILDGAPPILGGAGMAGGVGVGVGSEFEVGDGVQVLQAAPVGTGLDATQASVLFDRPILPLSDLDTMARTAPLSCSPDVGAQARWAGTSSILLVPPSGAFPRATAFACTVPAGLKALDGSVLEKELRFEFETPLLRVLSSSPQAGTDQARPGDPVELEFDQAVDPATLSAALTLREAGGRAVPLGPVEAGATDHRVVARPKLRRGTAYELVLAAGAVGEEGPLPTSEPWTLAFSTYPALVATPRSAGSLSPNAWISIDFSTPVSEAEVTSRLTVEPQPPGWDPGKGGWASRSWGYGIALEPRTTYTFTLDGGLEDTYGQRLGEPLRWTIQTTDYQPTGSFPGGLQLYPARNPPELPFKHLNVSRVELLGASFEPGSDWSPDSWSEAVEAVIGARGRPAEVEIDPAPNRTELEVWPFRDLLSPQGYGWVASRFSSPELRDWEGEVVHRHGLWVVTDLGGTVKFAPDRTEVWVTSLSGGEPVEGVEVVLRGSGAILGRSVTDAEGVAVIPRSPSRAADHRRSWVELRKGEDRSLVEGSWGPEGWNRTDQRFHLRSEGFLDRGVYRLGDPVHAYTAFRRADETGLVVPEGEVTWELTDPDGAVLASGEGPLGDRGGYSVRTALPPTGRLGVYTLRVNASGEGWSRAHEHEVSARAYRPPAFRVHVSAPERGVAGEAVQATLDARYLFGAELTQGKVSWSAWTEPRTFEPEGWEGWALGPEPTYGGEEGWEEGWEEGEAVPARDLPSASGELQAERTFSATLEAGTVRAPEALFLEASVTDVDRQVIAGRSETWVHPGELYPALRPASTLPTVGAATRVEVAAVDLEGRARAGTEVRLELVKRSVDSVRERGMDGRWIWVNTTTDTPVAQTSLRSGGGPVAWSVTPSEVGRHVLRASVTDAGGREVTTEATLWVVGSGFAGWGRADDGRLGLVLEKPKVAPGESARLLIQAPLPGLWALVTAERETVLWREVVKLEGTAPTVEIPTAAAWLPGVSLSVVAVTGAGPQDAPDKGRPEGFFGRVDLGVDSSREHLAVEVRPQGEVFRPRDRVDVEVTVRRDGKPAAGAGVVLYAVDEAVLSLTDYRTPDLYQAMYSPHGVLVATVDARSEILDRAPYLTKGAQVGGGGGAGSGGPEVRTRFLTTVTWQPDLRTGSDGTVRASFELPDNLTAFRVMAVADHGATSFGSAEREIRVTRPLVVRPALPRLLREGDEAFAGVVVHNDTDDSRWVEVGATVDGPVEIRGSPFGVTVPPRTSMEVPFQLRALEAGTARFTFRADSDDDHDAVEVPLEVERDVLVETVATAGLADGTWTERIARPDGSRPGFGGLRVDLATTALVGTTDGLTYLLDYPYGCAEQRTARGLGALAVLSVHERSGTPLSREVLEQRVRDVIQVLPAYQVGWPGGFAYWEGGGTPSVMATVYAVEFLARARAAGFPVSDPLLASGVAFLREAVRSPDAWYRGWDEGSRASADAHVAFALALAGAPDAGLVNRVWERRTLLPVFALARLQEAMALSKGDARVAEVARMIAARSTVEAASASVSEAGDGRWDRLWGSDDLATAAALEAAVAAGGSPLAPKYALHLATSRKTGHWQNTRATATALFALARYAERYETHAEAIRAMVTLAGEELISETLPVPGQASRELPMAKVANGPLEIRSDDPVYWFARLSYAPQVPRARDQGLGVQRHLELLEGSPDGSVVAGAMVRVTLVVTAPAVRHFVAVRDPIPAGLEPVDTSLATASRRDEEDDLSSVELPMVGGSWAFDHTELDDGEVRLFATYLPPGVHVYRYLARATTPGSFHHPPARAEQMYSPEVFGQTSGGTMVIGEGR